MRMVRVLVVQNEGLTALHMAAFHGHVDAVKALLAGGANVTATTVRGDVACVGAGTGCIAVSAKSSGPLHGVME
jgi:ankyrin repeat protein